MPIERLRLRSGVLVAVFLGHVGLILLLSESTFEPRQRSGAREPTQEPMILMLIEEMLREQEAPEIDESGGSDRARLLSSDMPSSPPAFDIVDPAAPDEHIHAQIDWSAEIERSAATAIDNQIAREKLLAQSRERLADRPKGIELYSPGRRPHRNGDTEHHPGETITWIDKRCYYSTAARVGPDAGPLTLALPICKKRSREDPSGAGGRFAHEEDWIPLQTDKNALPRLGGR